jgi:hypothetical protein
VRCLFAKLKLSARFQIKGRTCRLQFAHPCRTFLNKYGNRCGVAQGGSSGESVFPVKLGGIAGTKRSGYSSLCIGRGAVEEGALCEQGYTPRIRCPPRSV